MSAANPLSRRSFLAASATATAALAAPAVNAQGANERINVALIGTGGRCRRLMQSLGQVPNVRMVAVCDVYEPHLEQARELVRTLGQPDPVRARDYRELLNRRDVDAVLIASPDHWHVRMTVDACAAGKDVYVEKPLTHDLSEGRAVVEAQNTHRRIVQVGTQQRSMPQFARAREWIAAGRLGTVHKAHMTWNRNSDRVRRGPQNVDENRLDWRAFVGSARQQPFDAYRFRNWRWFWDFGNGIFADLMVHWADTLHGLLGREHPTQAVAVGHHNTSQGVWETPDTVQTVLTYPDNLQVYFEGTFCNARNGAMLEVMGTDATLYFDRGRAELIPERGRGRVEELILGDGPRGRDFYERPDGELLHLTNWVDCVRTRQRPACPAEEGVHAAAAAHLANLALRGNGVARWPG